MIGCLDPNGSSVERAVERPTDSCFVEARIDATMLGRSVGGGIMLPN